MKKSVLGIFWIALMCTLFFSACDMKKQNKNLGLDSSNVSGIVANGFKDVSKPQELIDKSNQAVEESYKKLDNMAKSFYEQGLLSKEKYDELINKQHESYEQYKLELEQVSGQTID